jgi:hypothetical protein
MWLKTPVLAVLSLLLQLSCADTAFTSGGESPDGMTPFAGGKFESSGVTHVPGTDGVLFVDNGRPGEVFWMRLDRDGKQAGDIKAVALGVDAADPEGITTDGSHFYVVGSQSKPKSAGQPGLVRFRFDAGRQVAEGVESVTGLRTLLVEKVAELKEVGGVKGKDGGVNVEGLAWDPRGGRLLLGLRSPIIDGKALLVPLRLHDPRGPFTYENLEVADGGAIRLPLGGLGVRSIEYDGRGGVFRIIAGAADDQEKTDFSLWEWDGGTRQAKPREAAKFDRKLKPEGVTRVSAGGREYTLVVFDSGGYSIMN